MVSDEYVGVRSLPTLQKSEGGASRLAGVGELFTS